MSENTRICFCIPTDYSKIAEMLVAYKARIVDANITPEEIDEFLAWHVDEFIDASFISEDAQQANDRLLNLFNECAKIGTPMTAVTSAIYESMKETGETGILYYRLAGDTEIKARTTFEPACTATFVREAFKNSGMEQERIERIWSEMMPVLPTAAMQDQLSI